MTSQTEIKTSTLSTKEFFSSFERHYQLSVIVVTAIIFLGFLIHAPALMDDVDSTHAAIGRTMIETGDWTTVRLNGLVYLDKSPFVYWAIACSYSIFGVYDWAARIPIALGAVLLCWVTSVFGCWAFGRRAALWSGIALSSCVGLFLFTRILIPDAILTFSVTLTLWAFLRAMDEEEAHPRMWAAAMAASIGFGLLVKSLVALVLPGGAAFLYLLVTRQLLSLRTWQRLRPIQSIAIMLALPMPWYAAATLRNPPYFDLTMHSEPGHFRGFFWNYFINEQVLRFMNRRYPHDYNTVPRLQFWLENLAWMFPWSVYLPASAKQTFRPTTRAGQARLLALCWIAFVMIFFSFSTTQEYYSMPIYPALALLIGSAIAAGGRAVRVGTRVAASIAAVGLIVIVGILSIVWNTPAPGDIVQALTQNPDAYTLSLGHMQDLTLRAFAYFRLPLCIAAIALFIGTAGGWILAEAKAIAALAVMMVVFFQATRIALIVMEPVLSSRPIAEALTQSPKGDLIVGDEYYTFSSVFFYANRKGLLTKRVNNLEYGSYAPGAPKVFIGDEELIAKWQGAEREYLVVVESELPRFESLLGKDRLYLVKKSGEKMLFCNRTPNQT